MAIKERQTSFAGGELAPTLYGRTDWPRYGTGARTLKNFLVGPHGQAMSRPGFQLVKTYLATTNIEDSRAVPFIFAEDDAVVLVFTELRIYVFANGAQVTDQGSPVSIVTPYSYTHIRNLRFSQQGDVLVITHPSHAPRTLSRLSADSKTWSLTTIDFVAPPYPCVAGGIPVVGAPGQAISYETDEIIDAATFKLADPAHPAREWTWAVSKIVQDNNTGRVWETQPFIVRHAIDANWTTTARAWTPTTSFAAGDLAYIATAHTTMSINTYRSLVGSNVGHNPREGAPYWEHAGETDHLEATAFGKLKLYPDRPIKITFMASAPYPEASGNTSRYGYLLWDGAAGNVTVLSTRVYRGREGHYGLVGETTGSFFVDEGATPDMSCQPRTNGSYFAASESYPTAVTHFEGRRFFAHTLAAPGVVWGSAVEDYNNFDEVVPPKESDSLTFEFAGDRLEHIRAMIPRRQLVVLTSGGEWVVNGIQNEVITPTSISAHQQSQHGCSANPAPAIAGDSVWFMSAGGMLPKLMLFGDDTRGYRVIDPSLTSRHLFEGYTIVDWAFQEKPWPVLWLVRSDGVILTCTYIPEQEMLAWSRQELATGAAESVAIVPDAQGANGDRVYVVARTGTVGEYKRHLLLMSCRRDKGLLDVECLDYFKVYNNWPVPVFTGLNDLAGVTSREEVYVFTGATTLGPYAVSNGSLTIGEPVAHAVIGLRYTCDFESLDCAQERGRQKITRAAHVEYTGSRGFQVGSSLADTLEAVPEASPLAQETNACRVPVSSTWAESGRVAVRHQQPTPLTILAVTREVELGGT